MIEIRPATSSDLKTIYEIENRIFTHPWTLEQIQAEFRHRNTTVIDVITRDGKVFGYLLAHEVGRDIQIVNLAIDIPFQHRGYGKMILKNYLSRNIDNSIVTLEVKRSNYNAINLYLNLGFKEIGRRVNYYQDNEDAIVMARGVD